MTGDELARFLANPPQFLGDWVLDTAIAVGTKVDKSTVQLASSKEPVEIASYPAASNRVSLYIDKNAERQTYTVSTNQTPNCQTKTGYRLPWASHKAYYTKLDGAADFFVTSRLNGCCVMIGGTAEAPMVVHANRGDSEIEAVARDADVNTKRIKLYDQFYWDVMGRLMSMGALDPERAVTLFDPGKYSKDPYVGRARVYGIRSEGAWAFYACIETSANKNEGADKRPVCHNVRIWPEAG